MSKLLFYYLATVLGTLIPLGSSIALPDPLFAPFGLPKIPPLPPSDELSPTPVGLLKSLQGTKDWNV